MKVEIWSDVMCPFCYIGKKRFEKGLAAFEQRDSVVIEWKSFLLNPGLKTDTSLSPADYLVQAKGMSPEQARQANAQVTAMARQEGLDYHLDKAVLANTLQAHRLLQLAKEKGKANEMEELLFSAYFTEGKNIDDTDTLQQLGQAAGLQPGDITVALTNESYLDKVQGDLYEAQQIGVRGVPYFVFNDRYVISGAQAGETFLGALNKAWEERSGE